LNEKAAIRGLFFVLCHLKTIGFHITIEDWPGESLFWPSMSRKQIGFHSNPALFQQIDCESLIADIIPAPFVYCTDSILASTFINTSNFKLSNKQGLVEPSITAFISFKTFNDQNDS
jgi:hypothetical protein